MMHAVSRYEPFAPQVIVAIAQFCMPAVYLSPAGAVPVGSAPAMMYYHFRKHMDLSLSLPLCRIHACGASGMLQGRPRG